MRVHQRRLSYEERLRMYESEKAMLDLLVLSAEEYERKIRKLADKWKV